MVLNNIDKYKEKRLSLIHSLERGEIDKNEFLRRTDEIFKDVDHIEPNVINTIDEALYFYQYFNSKAKSAVMSMKGLNKNSYEYKNLSSFVDEYYEAKENVIYKFLRLLDRDDYEAYFVKLASSKLKNRLIEIDVHALEKVILHSMSTKNLRYLRSIGKMDNEIRVSKIDDYINNKY